MKKSKFAYIIDQKLTDNAIDRFSGASISKAMMERKQRTQNMTIEDKSVLRDNSKPIGWVRSHSVCKILRKFKECKKSGLERGDIHKDVVMRNMGLGNMQKKTSFELQEYDVVLFCLFQDEHWSLMVCYVQSTGPQHVFHYDSMYPFHLTMAEEVFRSMVYFGILEKEANLHSVSGYPIQKENFECGYTVLLMVSCICNIYKDKTKTEEISKGVEVIPKHMFPVVSPEGARNLSKIIFNFLGSSHEGDYPPEKISFQKEKTRQSSGTTKHKPSLLSYYNHFRCQMIEENIKIKHQYDNK